MPVVHERDKENCDYWADETPAAFASATRYSRPRSISSILPNPLVWSYPCTVDMQYVVGPSSDASKVVVAATLERLLIQA